MDAFIPITNGGEKSASLISTILDEEAIANLISGDILFSVSNWSPKPTTIVSYDYDDDFNYTETVTEGSEELPDLLLMISSEDINNVESILEFTTLESPLKKDENYYFLPHNREIPMDLFIFTTNEGLFITNNSAHIQQVKSGTSTGVVSKEIAGNVLLSTQSVHVNFKEISKVISSISGTGKNEALMFEYLSNNTGTLNVKQSRTKGKSSSTETILSFPEGNDENGLVYIFKLINEVYKIEK